MSFPPTDEDNETWLLEAGDAVIEKKAAQGWATLTASERLIYCLWVADYGMRNGGDLQTAGDLYQSFLAEGEIAARQLGLPNAMETFSLDSDTLERRYFELFDPLVSEIRSP